jgi:hypothetical protein
MNRNTLRIRSIRRIFNGKSVSIPDQVWDMLFSENAPGADALLTAPP